MELMAESRYYAKAPIKEAILDIRVDLPAGAGLRELRGLLGTLADEYPDQKPIATLEAQFSASDKVTASASQKPVGFKLVNSEGNQVVQFRTDGFTFSRLAPYPSWREIRAEALRLWKHYRAGLEPRYATRAAVRYINRLDMPLPLKDFREYLQTVPEIAPGLPQGLSNFFMQLQIPLASVPALAIVNETLVPPANDRVVSVILDIDVIYEAERLESDEEIRKCMDRLRDEKNAIFEESITDNTRRLIS